MNRPWAILLGTIGLAIAIPAVGTGLGGGVIGGSAGGGGGGGGGDFLADGSVDMTGALAAATTSTCTNASIYPAGGSTSDGIAIAAGGATRFCDANAEMLELASSATIFNDPGNDIDFRIESGSEANALYLNAGTNRWSMGGDVNPEYQLEMVAEAAETAGLSQRYFGTVTVPNIQIYRGRGTEASPTAVTSGDVLGRLYFAGQSDSGDGNFNTGAFIGANADGNWSLSDTPTDFHIDVATASTTRDEVFTVEDNSGSPRIVLNKAASDYDFKVFTSASSAALTVDGALHDVIINESQISGYDLRVYGDTVTDILRSVAGSDCVGFSSTDCTSGTTDFGTDITFETDSAHDIGSDTERVQDVYADQYSADSAEIECPAGAGACDFGTITSNTSGFIWLDCQDGNGCTGADLSTASPPADGTIITLIGRDDLLSGGTTTITDGSGVGYDNRLAGNATLGPNDTLTVVYMSAADAFIEISRSDN